MKLWCAATRRIGGIAAVWLVFAAAGCVSDRYPQGVVVGAPAGPAALGEDLVLGDGLEAFYRWDGPDAITAVLVPRGAAAAQADYPALTVVRVMWRPRAGATPLSRTATNAAVRHLVFAGPAGEAAPRGAEPRDEPTPGVPAESLGLFAGAGFVALSGDPAEGVLDVWLREADLRLTDCSAGYTHPLRRAGISARVRADRDDAAVSRWLKAAGVRATEALGYPAWVRASPPAVATPPGGYPLISSDSGVDRCFLAPPPPPSGA